MWYFSKYFNQCTFIRYDMKNVNIKTLTSSLNIALTVLTYARPQIFFQLAPKLRRNKSPFCGCLSFPGYQLLSFTMIKENFIFVHI